MLKLKTTTLMLLVALSACADPHEYKVPTESSQWKQDENFKKSIKELPEDEKALITAYLIRAGFAETLGAPIPERSIGEAIQNQKDFIEKKVAEKAAKEEEEAKQADLAAKVKAEQDAKIAEAREALTVAVTKLEFVPKNFRANRYRANFDVVIALQNNTDKTMSGVKGTIVFSDMFNDEIQRVDLSIDTPIPAGRTHRQEADLKYNQFNDEDKKLANTELSKMKISWEPLVYLFADGTKMELK